MYMYANFNVNCSLKKKKVSFFDVWQILFIEFWDVLISLPVQVKSAVWHKWHMYSM